MLRVAKYRPGSRDELEGILRWQQNVLRIRQTNEISGLLYFSMGVTEQGSSMFIQEFKTQEDLEKYEAKSRRILGAEVKSLQARFKHVAI